ncbi:class I SAM-dependent methyltransferase [Streptomyces sp. VRA16 Mangrove soil]|uniref:class I SAM-dependent methyltransferase n=1 Tax=Streptomyces sp. VRA16 Mangrove soil TaxID=2817434 RepID=UPI001A9F74E7|nr:class I SAM-dependent methyltransferase [Streptomyces sp. VRA16 Mangrove soil]MBO1331149.1 class I SAM-dependent methyltransferase [Streptomyces sp. VRA16 Mangrove soil]
MNRTVRTTEDVLNLLDRIIAADARPGDWWDRFYADRDRGVPFFVDKPDENLTAHLDKGLIPAGARVLDLGCGPGRNAVHLAALGHDVDAVDLSATALAWGEERAAAAGIAVRFHRNSIFDVRLPHGSYDLIYDSGCLHHLPPHRRVSYLALLDRLLAPGGHFGLTCFAAGEMGSERPDADVYDAGTGLEGGLAFTDAELRHLFQDLDPVEIRPMAEQDADSPTFGKAFLLTALFRRSAH